MREELGCLPTAAGHAGAGWGRRWWARVEAKVPF